MAAELLEWAEERRISFGNCLDSFSEAILRSGSLHNTAARLSSLLRFTGSNEGDTCLKI